VPDLLIVLEPPLVDVSNDLSVNHLRLVPGIPLVPRARDDQEGVFVGVVLRDVAVEHRQALALAAHHLHPAEGNRLQAGAHRSRKLLSPLLLLVPLASPPGDVDRIIGLRGVSFLGIGAVLLPNAVLQQSKVLKVIAYESISRVRRRCR
jgi:hypothetical protein